MLPPKIGLGHEGSSAGADHFSPFFSAVSATAAIRICGRGAAAADWRRGVPAKPRWAVQGRCAVCIAVIMAVREAEDVDADAERCGEGSRDKMEVGLRGNCDRSGTRNTSSKISKYPSSH